MIMLNQSREAEMVITINHVTLIVYHLGFMFSLTCEKDCFAGVGKHLILPHNFVKVSCLLHN